MIILSLTLNSSSNYSQSNISNNVVEKGIGLGNIIAVTISWSRNKSILYAIIHGVLGWVYVIYVAIVTYNKK